MNKLQTRLRRRAENGSIAIETAFSLLVLSVFIVIPFLLARIFWFYSVAEKAAHDGARFLSNAAQHEIVAPTGSGGDEASVARLAESIAHAELDEIKPALDWFSITALCDLDECGFEVPETVRVSVRLRIRHEMFGSVAADIFGEDPLQLEARVTMRYVGN